MQLVGEKLFLIFFWVCFIGLLWMPITWLLLSIFTPKKLLDKYFKEPHFSLTETIMLKEFPGFLMRTAIFGWLLIFPSLDKKRNIKNVSSYMPRWYAIALNVFNVGVISTLAVIVTILPTLLIMDFISS